MKYWIMCCINLYVKSIQNIEFLDRKDAYLPHHVDNNHQLLRMHDDPIITPLTSYIVWIYLRCNKRRRREGMLLVVRTQFDVQMCGHVRQSFHHNRRYLKKHAKDDLYHKCVLVIKLTSDNVLYHVVGTFRDE
jgi:hypothetical protein